MGIYLVFALNIFNGVSMQAGRLVIVLYALDLGAQPLTIGILAATYSFFPATLAVTIGRLGDRYGSRRLLSFGAVGSGLGMVLPYFMPGLPAVFIVGTMMGFSTAIYGVSLQNLVGVMSDAHDRARNFSNYSLANSTVIFLGPLIAGFSVEHTSHVTACLYLALLTLVPAILLAIWGRLLPGGTASDDTKAVGGIRAILSDPAVRGTLATSSLLVAGVSLFQFYLPVYAHSIGISASVIGIVVAMNSAAAIVVRLILPRLITRFTEEKLLAYAFYVGAASLIAVPFFKAAVLLGLVSFIFGLGMGVGHPIVTMLMFSSSAQGRSGETLGLKVTVNQLTKVVSPVVFGSIASVFGLPPMFWLNAMLMGTGGLMSRTRKNK